MNNSKVLQLAFAATGIGLLIAVILMSYENIRLTAFGIKTNATIIDYRITYSGSRLANRIFTPVFEFTDSQGRRLQKVSRYGDEEKFKLRTGQQTSIYYRTDSEIAVEPKFSSLYQGPLIFGSVGLLLTASSWILGQSRTKNA